MTTEKLIDTPKECIICLELVDTQQLPLFKDCSHTNSFHAECIRTWIDKCIDEHHIDPVCPICRNELICDNANEGDSDRINYFNSQSLGCFCCFISCCILSMLYV